MPLGIRLMVAAPRSSEALAAVATTTASNDPGRPGRSRDRARIPATTATAMATGVQTGEVAHAWTASQASTSTFSAWTSEPRAAGSCWSAMIAAIPTVKPSTTGTGT